MLSTDLSTARGKINFLFNLYNAIKFAYPVAFVAARTPYERKNLSEYRIQMFKEFGLLGEYDPEVWENLGNWQLDEATEKEKDTMTKENGRTYENSSELDEALKKIHMSLRAYRSRLDGEVLYINFFDDALVDIKCPDNNHIDGYWFQWNAQTSGNYKTSKIIKNVMDVVNNLLAQFDTYTPEGFFDPDDQNSEDEEDHDF